MRDLGNENFSQKNASKRLELKSRRAATKNRRKNGSYLGSLKNRADFR